MVYVLYVINIRLIFNLYSFNYSPFVGQLFDETKFVQAASVA
jgi:hypothetical protein